MQLTTCVVIISSIWLFSVFVTLPYGLYMNHKYVDGRFYCEETWPSENFRQVSGCPPPTRNAHELFCSDLVTFSYIPRMSNNLV